MTQHHYKYTGSNTSIAISFFGAVVLFTVFPIMVMDPSDGVQKFGFLQALSVAPLSVWYSMAASCTVGTAFSLLINGRLIARDFINSLVAGGIASTTASMYFLNPVWPMILGSGCGIFQVIFQKVFESKQAKNNNIVNTHSFFLFGFQGFLGAMFASIFRKVIVDQNNNFDYNMSSEFVGKNYAGYDMAMACLSAAMGLGFGALLGILVFCSYKHLKQDNFEDYTYWLEDDGLRYAHEKTVSATPFEDVEPDSPGDIYIKETNINVKSKHAYL